MFLAGINLLLLAVLLVGGYSLPAARAQRPAGRPGDWLAVTAKAEGQNYDILYLLNRGDRKLYALSPSRTDRRRYEPIAFRDLKQDFQRD